MRSAVQWGVLRMLWYAAGSVAARRMISVVAPGSGVWLGVLRIGLFYLFCGVCVKHPGLTTLNRGRVRFKILAKQKQLQLRVIKSI